MMSTRLRIACSVALFFVLSTTAAAGLIEYPGAPGLVYDPVEDITWLKDANATDHMNWGAAMQWAVDFEYTSNGTTYSDWRLPTTESEQSAITGEWGTLNTAHGIDSDNPGPFVGLFDSDYWTDVEYDATRAFTFTLHPDYLGQYYNDKTDPGWEIRAWPVFDGRPVPEPASGVLLVLGGLMLLLLRRRR